MVRHDVDDVPEAVRLQGTTKGVIVGLGTQLGVERAVVADVVAVETAGVGLEIWRAIALGHAKLGEVRNQIPRGGETEAAMELQAVRAHRLPR